MAEHTPECTALVKEVNRLLEQDFEVSHEADRLVRVILSGEDCASKTAARLAEVEALNAKMLEALKEINSEIHEWALHTSKRRSPVKDILQAIIAKAEEAL